MKGILIVIFVLFVCAVASAQQISSPEVFNSPVKIKSFADYLFCGRDYPRAAAEYERYLQSCENDTARYKLALSLMNIEKYVEASSQFQKIKNNSVLYNSAIEGYCKNAFLMEDYNAIDDVLNRNSISAYKTGMAEKLSMYSLLMADKQIDKSLEEFVKPFDGSDKKQVEEFYLNKKEPGYASPLKAALLSALIPGSGKIYAGETGDGIISALITGLFGFLAYDNFHNNHQFRGYLFTGLGMFFYASNIYGSAAQAQIFNAKIDFNFNLELKSFLESKKYFSTEEPGFCR